MSVLCIACHKEVDGRRHSISCDVCERWQHRLCGTGKVYLFIYLFIYSLFCSLYIVFSSLLITLDFLDYLFIIYLFIYLFITSTDFTFSLLCFPGRTKYQSSYTFVFLI